MFVRIFCDFVYFLRYNFRRFTSFHADRKMKSEMILILCVFLRLSNLHDNDYSPRQYGTWTSANSFDYCSGPITNNVRVGGFFFGFLSIIIEKRD